MSDEEQQASIGRIVMERAKLRTECAILRRHLMDAGEQLFTVSTNLRNIDSANQNQTAALLNALDLHGVKADLSALMSASVRVSTLTLSLREAGAE